MNTNITIGYLSWLTNENYTRRIQNYTKSLNSLSLLENQNCSLIIVNNGNNELTQQEIIKAKLNSYKLINLNKNYNDVAVHFCTYWTALNNNHDYMIYTYDDFVFYDNNFIDSCIEFMDTHKNIWCMRIPKYESNNKFFDTRYTSKNINPESVNHILGHKSKKFIEKQKVQINDYTFCENNWRPISRPTLWRVSDFKKIVERVNVQCPVLQNFEKFMFNVVDSYDEYSSSYINKGVCYTFSQDTSERTRLYTHKQEFIEYVDINQLSYIKLEL